MSRMARPTRNLVPLDDDWRIAWAGNQDEARWLLELYKPSVKSWARKVERTHHAIQLVLLAVLKGMTPRPFFSGNRHWQDCLDWLRREAAHVDEVHEPGVYQEVALLL